MIRRLLVISLLGVLVACSSLAWAAPAKNNGAGRGGLVYVADYSQQASHGIYTFRFDAGRGKLTAMGKAADVVSPSFFVTDPRHRILYVATDQDDDPKKTGSISSFSIDPASGRLTLLNKVDAHGDPCHLVVDKTGTILFSANYNSGTVVSFALQPDGRIGRETGFVQLTGSGPVAARQTGPHAHEVVLSPDDRFLFVPDLGSDRISIFRVDVAKQTFTAHSPAFVAVSPGLGPRHFVFAPGGKFAYAVCEIGSTVVTFTYDAAAGVLRPVQTLSTLPAGFSATNDSAEIAVDRAGRFVYASNRGHNSVAVFGVNAVNGTLAKVQVAPTLGDTPRHFVLDPSGKFLLVGNQLSDDLVVFHVDADDGKLTPVGSPVSVSKPVCILFVPQ